MEIIIRKPNLQPKLNGIPKDFAQVRDYFNQALKHNPRNIGARNSLKQIEKLLTAENSSATHPE